MEHCNPLLRGQSSLKFITVGEIMLRLTPPNYGKIRVSSSFEASYGGSEANIALLEEPEAGDDFFSAYTDYKIALVDKIAAYYPGVDMLEISDDWGHKNGLLFSPAVYDRHFAPQIRRLIQHIRSKGFLYLQHSCGKNEDLVPHMVAAGIDAWTSSQAINDLHKIIVSYGSQIICSGGMDLQEFYAEDYPAEEMRRIVQE